VGPPPQPDHHDAPALLERHRELARIEKALADARRGPGALVVIEGPAGIGKTRLLSAAVASACERGVMVLSARGAQLEQDFAFGIVRQLLEPALRATDGAPAPQSLRGAAWKAVTALELIPGIGRGAAAGTGSAIVDGTAREDPGVIVHGLYWVIASLAERAPLLVCIDDAHWSDSPSGRFVAYLSQRLEDLPVTLVLATRPGEQGRRASGIAEVVLARHGELISLPPLSEAACAELVRAVLSETAEPSFCQACHVATGGNPFLLVELIAELRRSNVPPTSQSAARVGALRPDRVARSVLATIARLGQHADELARAVAVLGTGARPRWVRELATLTAGDAASAIDSLVAARILTHGQWLEFAHPIAGAVVYESIPEAQRAVAHAQAAQILRRESAEPDRVAAQLLLAEPGADEQALGTLLEAAQRARQRGAPEVAATYLRRVLEEPLTVQERVQARLELGRERVSAGDPNAIEDLASARAASQDLRLRAAIALELGRGLMLVDRSPEALDLFTDSRAELGDADPALSSLLRAEEVGASLLDITTAERATSALGGGDFTLAGETLGERLLLAYGSYLAALRCARAGGVAASALRALAHGDLISEQTMAAFCFSTFALCTADRTDAALRSLDQAIQQAHERGSVLIFVLASWMRSHAHYRRGELDAAETDATGALDAVVDDWFTAPVAFLADVLIERGELQAAEELFAGHHLSDAVFPNLPVATFVLDARGRLRCAQRRWREGLEDLLAVGERLRAWEEKNPAIISWRSSSALAHAALAERDEACRLSEEEVALARSFGAARGLGVALRAAGLVHEDATSIELLGEAVTALEASHARLELARALTDLGAALRRGGRRIDAREPLRRGLDLASGCGATVLAARARDELVAAGARPRRERTRGVTALTASERRIATLAASGMSNREIAQALFITIRTVKAHLGHIFQKLDIARRDELADAMATADVARDEAEIALGSGA
jgi:DNA-binding CsgD family transcriptional regulator